MAHGYALKVRRYYYDSPVHRWEWDDPQVVYESREAAKREIEERYASIYYLDHNEYARPDYRVVTVR